MKIRHPFIPISISIIVLLVCNLPSSLMSKTKRVDETSSAIPEPMVTKTATALSNQPCPVLAGEPELNQTSAYIEMPDNVLQYLNAGGDFENLIASLEGAGMVTTFSPPLIEKDFTADGYQDVVFILLDPEPEFMVSQGALILYRCQGDRYEIAYQSIDSTEWSAPTIYSAADLNADAIADLLVGRQTCGAHTCFQQFRVLSWNGTALENLMQGSAEDMPNPTIEVRPEETEILVTAEGIGSVGAGPFRRFVRSWTWDPVTGSFLSTPDLLLPSPFRIHALHDADQAIADGDYAQAIELYTRVIEDDELQGWVDPAAEREILGAYATFGLMLAHLHNTDIETAEAAYTTLLANYPLGNPGSDFAQMAEVVWSEYQASNDIEAACLAAQAFASSHQETLLDTLYFGYANPTYTAEDICLIQD